MYLKSIKLDGFKSFKNKTVFDLNKGITAIVGPNGSGKSNIVDAIRWVLGEQSVKSLRGGENMSDVIFSGTETEPALNKASVVLTFDNEDNFFNSEFKEIEVKRCIYKSGESEYFINNTKVRLKDVTDLFISTGGSLEDFNIISQGSVTNIVNSKPKERRMIIESAAGVLKYKKRKEESMKKLEKTKDNLSKVELVIKELESTVNPLKEQATVAKKYLELKEELKNNEISLVTHDIKEINDDIKSLNDKKDALEEKINNYERKNNVSEIEKIKLDIFKLDDKISENNQKIIKLTEEIALTSSEERIAKERTKYSYNKDDIKNNLLNLKEEELKLIKIIESSNYEIDLNDKEAKEKEDTLKKLSSELNNLIAKKEVYDKELEDLNKEKLNLENKIEILENNLKNNEYMPSSVKSILNNPRLKGIHNVLNRLIKTDNEYAIVIETLLSSSKNFIVVDNETSAKNAINYLKDNSLGTATFLPINIIKERKLPDNIIDRIKEVRGFVDVASNLVTTDEIYKNIIDNQLGNVIVTKDIDSMNLIAKILEYKYRVVALDGSIIYAGGIISGGTRKKDNSINIIKNLENNKNELSNVSNKIDKTKTLLQELIYNLNILNSSVLNKKSELINLSTTKKSKIDLLEEYENNLRIIKNDINGLTDLKNNALDDSLLKLMDKLNTLNIEKDKLEVTNKELKDKKENLNDELRELEKESSESNFAYKKLSMELNDINVNLGKQNVKLDNLLIILNEDYNITYEFAKENYELLFDINLMRTKVHKLKIEIKSLGDVNTGSIKEYERLNERYEFLNSQKDDLEISINNLLNIIKDMDNIMIDKFKSTYNKVSEEFSKVFKIMFQGGVGKLELTDPTDYLNTGIDLIIMPPGKKIYNTQSLSGGEKSLTAICLLFAVLNVSPPPYIILDEVEAALDEVNVDLFGEYLNKKKNESQYILITHKKRMMEYADVLYGITMQNAGISKVVGVKLSDI